MSKNNIAILILAHHNLEQLSLLIKHLQSDFDIYVQVDKKSDLNVELLPKASNTYYFKEIDVYWGHVSQVYNMKFILEQAFLKGYERYCFISGDDLPIKSNVYIKNFFSKHKNEIFMYANPLPIKTWGFNKGFDRLDRYWFMQSDARKLVKIRGRITLIIQRLLGIKIKRFPLNYYGGSNWLNLTNESLMYIFNFLNNNPLFLKKLKYSRATDEIWIQSIIMNSTLKNLVINDDLRYIDWETGPDYPRTLANSDFENILKSKGLFGRKFKLIKNDKSLHNFLKLLK
jgi:hypothetical protein